MRALAPRNFVAHRARWPLRRVGVEG